MSYKLSLCLLFVTFGVNTNGKSLVINSYLVEGYYWRDYTGGDIPDDAVPGGTADKWRTTYIGQTLHPGFGLLPGRINEDTRKVYYEYGNKEYSTAQDVKILCSRRQGQLEWIVTKNGDNVIDLIKQKQLVLGGRSGNRPLAIGKTTIQGGEVLTGKVLVVGDKFDNLMIAKDGIGWHVSSYDVLVSNRNISSTSATGCVQKVIKINVY